MSILVFLAMGFGLLVGGIAVYHVTRYVQWYFSARSSAPKLVANFAAIGALLGLIPSAFLLFVAGGTFGGSFFSAVLGSYGAPIGIALGMFVVLVAGVAGCSIVSAIIGRLVGRLALDRTAT